MTDWKYQAQEALRAKDAAFARVDALRQQVEDLTAAIRDIDAHATPLGTDDDGFVSTGYLVSVGAIHRAVALAGTGAKPARALPVEEPTPDETKPARSPECVERWPECESGAYDPRCCRFPKSCSCTAYDVVPSPTEDA